MNIMEYQVCETEKGNCNFIIYNLLGFFKGHYLVTVNIDTFEWAVQQYSDYGSFTWTSSPTDYKIYKKKDVPKIERLKMEAYIAYSLICCYKKHKVTMEIQMLISKEPWYKDLL